MMKRFDLEDIGISRFGGGGNVDDFYSKFPWLGKTGQSTGVASGGGMGLGGAVAGLPKPQYTTVAQNQDNRFKAHQDVKPNYWEGNELMVPGVPMSQSPAPIQNQSNRMVNIPRIPFGYMGGLR